MNRSRGGGIMALMDEDVIDPDVLAWSRLTPAQRLERGARLLETYLAVAPGGWRTFPTVLSNWLGEKLDLRKAIRAELPGLRRERPGLRRAHLAGAML